MDLQLTPQKIEEFNTRIKDVKNINDLLGKEGVFTNLFKDMIENMLESELTDTLGYPKGKGSRTLKQTSNKRNGVTSKKIRSSLGDMEIDIPRDRENLFEPKIIEKYQKNTNEIENKIIGMYGRGMTVGDINEHLGDIYGISVSDGMISDITNKILPDIRAWQNRPLEAQYAIVFIDAIHYKMHIEGMIKNCAAYIVLGVNLEGHKEILGIWIGEEEGSKFWLSVLTEIQSRGVQDILICCSDNLSGISESILSVYPKTMIQKCVIHQIRNSLKYIASKDVKLFLSDLKTVYKASTLQEAEDNFQNIKDIWGNKYPLVFRSWENNWDEVTAYFQFSEPIRKIIYTTNTIESLNRFHFLFCYLFLLHKELVVFLS